MAFWADQGFADDGGMANFATGDFQADSIRYLGVIRMVDAFKAYPDLNVSWLNNAPTGGDRPPDHWYVYKAKGWSPPAGTNDDMILAVMIDDFGTVFWHQWALCSAPPAGLNCQDVETLAAGS